MAQKRNTMERACLMLKKNQLLSKIILGLNNREPLANLAVREVAEELAVDKEVRGKRQHPSKADANGEERSKLGLEEADHSCIRSKVMTKVTLTVVEDWPWEIL